MWVAYGQAAQCGPSLKLTVDKACLLCASYGKLQIRRIVSSCTDKLHEVRLDEQQVTGIMQQQLGSIMAWVGTYVGAAGNGRPGVGARLDMDPSSQGMKK